MTRRDTARDEAWMRERMARLRSGGFAHLRPRGPGGAHGLRSTYVRRQCRCELCLAANRAYGAEHASRKRGGRPAQQGNRRMRWPKTEERSMTADSVALMQRFVWPYR